MRGRIIYVMIVGALALSGADVILDRIAVTVGKQVITEGEVVRDLRVAAKRGDLATRCEDLAQLRGLLKDAAG